MSTILYANDSNVNSIIRDIRVRIVPKHNLRMISVLAYCNNSGHTMNNILESLRCSVLSKETILRWEVNYVRHYLVNDYDRIVNDVIDDDNAYIAYKKAVLMHIGEAYPWLAGECSRQAVSIANKAA